METKSQAGVRFRLGFWNRLAVVSGSLFAVGFPTWRVLAINDERSRASISGYQACIDRLPLLQHPNRVMQCGEAWLNGTQYLGWNDWFMFSGFALFFALAGYAIIWAIVTVGKWVWRGRSVSN